MRYSITLSFLIYFSCIATAQKYDYQWPFGYEANFDNNFGISILDFNQGEVSTFPFAEIDPQFFQIGAEGSFICDSSGEIMLMTNNCIIVDENFNIIEGADTLTPGPTYNEYCNASWGSDYPSFESSIFFPDLSNDSTYFLANRDAELWIEGQDVVAWNYYLNTIVQKNDGSFYIKNRIALLENFMMTPPGVVACLDHNGTAWWLYAIKYNSNEFHVFRIGSQGEVLDTIVQDIGPNLKTYDVELQSSFSPDGRLLAISSPTHGVLLYDFDNASGALSNFRTIEYPGFESARGLCFSPSSRFLYVNTPEDIYQIDLMETDPDERIYHIGTFRSYAEDGWPVGIGLMQLGPDCRIYVSPGSATWYAHVIHHPDQKGAACTFEERAIRTPTRVLHIFPNRPPYYTTCDSTISWGIVSDTEEVLPDVNALLEVFPNPATEQVHIRWEHSLEFDTYINIHDTMGRLIKKVDVNKGLYSITLNVNDLAPGVYFVSFNGQTNTTSKLIISG